MFFRRKPIRLFELYEPKRFSTTKLDKAVVTIVLVVFIWAFFVDSFRPITNEDGEPIMVETHRGFRTIPNMNMQFFLAPIIFSYEMLVLIMLDGKLKGRDLPWGLYLWVLRTSIVKKFKSGIEEYRNWRKFKNK